VLDITSPTAPVFVGAADTAGTVLRISLANGKLVVADSDAGISVLDDCRAVVFEDGFEAFATSAWSAVVP